MSDLLEQLSSARTYQGQLKNLELSDALQALESLDKASEQKKQLGCLLSLGGIAGLFGGVVLAVSAQIPALSLICVGGLAALVWGLLTRSAAGKTDFEDRRYQLLNRMSRLLEVDMAADSLWELRLDLQPVDHSSKNVGSGKVGIWNVDYYEDPWLSLQGQLLDGTRFSVGLTEKYQYRHRKKISASGKLKHKSKTKTALQAVVSVKPKEKRYPGAGQLGQQARGAVQVPATAQVKDLSVRENVLTLKTASRGDWTVDTTTHLLSQMLLSLYQVLNLSRKIDKAQSS